VAGGLDYRTVCNRGDWEDAALDRPLSTSFRFPIVPRASDLVFMPLVLSAYLFSPQARAYLRATYRKELGRRLSLSNAVIKYRTYQHAKQWKPDVILAQFLWNLKPAAALADALDVPVLAVAHGSDVFLDDQWMEAARHPRIKHIFCISNALKERVDSVVGAYGKTTSLLHNPIASVYLEDAVVPGASGIRVVCIATLRELKNHAWLFRALKVLGERGVPFSCELIGEPFGSQASFKDELRALTVKLGIADRCHFLGWMDPASTREKIDESTVLVLPSRSEGMGMVVVEAIARRRTPVGTDIPGIREATFNGEFGILCPLDDDIALADALEEAHRRTISDQDALADGRQRVMHEFSPQHYVRELVNHANRAMAM